MNCLSVATAKGRINAAGYLKLAVFFFCLSFFSLRSQTASASEINIPFVKDGKLYSFNSDSDGKTKSYDFKNASNVFTQKSVCVSKESGYILAWNKKTQELWHIDDHKKISSKALLTGSLVYVDKNFVLSQGNSFDENKGFEFSLYSINYADKSISLKKIWTGFEDCFISDCFFTGDRVCIIGGNREDSINSVFYITADGIHKCFSTAKKSDFLRLINTGKSVYAFLSGRDKSPAQPVIYQFSLNDYTESRNPDCIIELKKDPSLSEAFECFFGFGFAYQNRIILPASIKGSISFMILDPSKNKITSVVPDATGCISILSNNGGGVYYMARDPLIADSFYGISLFDGSECKKIVTLK